MSTMTRLLEGHDTLRVRLDDEYDALHSSAALAPGRSMAEHQADGPTTVQAYQGKHFP
jgi:hypothetical protein